MSHAPRREISVCQHCAAPLAAGEATFCCAGCAAAYELIRGRGLTDYYKFRDVAKARPVDQEAAGFDYLTSDEYRKSHVRREQEALHTDWYLDGITCPACAWLIEKVALDHDGVRDASLNFREARLSLSFGEATDLKALAESLASLGYRAGLQPERQDRGSSNRELLKLGISGALAANIMLMSMPFYTGLSDGWYAIFFGWIAFLLTLPLLGFCARDFFTRAMAGLRRGMIDLDLPIALGLASAFALSTFYLIIGDVHHLYFDSMGMLVFFLLVGRTVQRMGVRRALSASRRLLASMPQLTAAKRAGAWVQVPAGELQVDEQIRLRSGDILPVDAQLLAREAVFNAHVVTGEAKPVDKRAGDEVLAGSVNMGAPVTLRVAALFDDSRFSRLAQMAKELSAAKNTDAGSRKAMVFVAVVSCFALIGAVAWWSTSPLEAFSVALTIFIVACPCALALSQPTAQAFALRETSRLGVWIKSTDVFEALRRIRRVVFDKTGILTEGAPSIVAKRIFDANPHWAEAALLELERSANHPIVKAFEADLKPRLKVGRAYDVRLLQGSGVSGYVDGRKLIAASPKGLARFDAAAPACEAADQACAELPKDAAHVCFVVDDQLAAVFALRDELRKEAPELMTELRRRELDLTVLSGDNQQAVDAVGETLQLDHNLGHMLPEEKLAYLKDHEAERTLMAGDGLNDMGALAAAGVGVTHDQATDAAVKFADIILQGRDLSRLDALFAVAHTARRAVRNGILLSLAYNVVAITLALTGTIGPLIAAVLMPLSSLSMIGAVALTFKGSRTWAS